MSVTNILLLAAASLLTLQGTASSAAAQSADERARSRRSAELNQLGILEFCQAQGMVEDKVVSAERKFIQHSSGSQAFEIAGSLEEEAGRAGFLAFGEHQGRFVESAMAQGVTLKTACQIRAAAVPETVP